MVAHGRQNLEAIPQSRLMQQQSNLFPTLQVFSVLLEKLCGRLSRLGWMMRTRSSLPIIYVYFLLLCRDHLPTFL
jgi:hypothetical protein